jgi:hypothetical protein
MATWRKRLFIATAYIAADAAEYFGLPSDRTVVMGARIDLLAAATCERIRGLTERRHQPDEP